MDDLVQQAFGEYRQNLNSQLQDPKTRAFAQNRIAAYDQYSQNNPGSPELHTGEYDPLETSYHSQIRQAALADDQSSQMARFFTPPPGQGAPQPGGTAPGSSRFTDDTNQPMMMAMNHPMGQEMDARYRPRQDRGAPRRTESGSIR